MIKHHPKFELLQAFVNGELPASLAAGVAIHADMCLQCQQTILSLTEQVAEVSFEQAFLHNFAVDSEKDVDSLAEINFDDMVEEITACSDLDVPVEVNEKTVSFKNKQYTLPRALSSMDITAAANIGKLSRSRVNLEEGEIHTSLLHIEPGGSVPEHTHNGFELTVLLAGCFEDDEGEYVPGDFIMLDSSHTHRPHSPSGCLCFTVANDSLHFTKGINKLLNPIGSFIY